MTDTPSPARATTRQASRRLSSATLLAVTLAGVWRVTAIWAGALSAVSPGGASPGVSISVIGTGFNTTAAQNEVTFVPPAGAPLTSPGLAITTLNAATGTRRLTVRVPAGLPDGTTGLRVRNMATGETSEGRSLEVVSLNLPATRSAAPGATNVQVALAGSARSAWNTNTRAVFGAGITVHATTVQSATSAVATISVASNAVPGPRDVTMLSNTQTALAIGAFVVAAANRSPAFTSQPVTTIALPRQYLYQPAATDPDGDAVTLRVLQGPPGMVFGAGAVSWTPSAGDLGVHAVTLEATDGRGGSATQSYQITVVDDTPPVAWISGPARAVAGSQAVVTVQAADDVGVARVTFDVNGASPTDAPAPPYQRIVDIPSGTAAGAVFRVRATALDPSGNDTTVEHVVTVVPQPDATKPSVQLHAPNDGVPGATVPISATALDDTGVAYVEFLVGGAVVATDTLAPFEAAFVIPSGASLGSQLTVAAEAVDFAGNRAQSARALTVVASPDTTPPAVQLAGPQQVAPGNLLALLATATDAGGISEVEFYVNGVLAGTALESPYRLAYVVAADAVVGARLLVQARALDFAGLDARALMEVTIVAGPANGAPTAHAGGPYSIEVGQPLALTAAASQDPDGDPLSASWDFGDGATGAGLGTTHTFHMPGRYLAIVTVDDGRGGVGTAAATIDVLPPPDRAAPAVLLVGPRQALPGERIVLTAQATDDIGVTGVTFVVDGGPPTDQTAPPYQRTIDVPAVATPGASIRVEATARDAAGKSTTAMAVVAVASAPDTTPPAVQVNAPPSVAPGASLRLSASAQDDVGLASVTFYVDGVSVGAVAAPAYEVSFAVPSGRAVGSVLAVLARAQDFAGNQAESTAAVTVVASPDTTAPLVIVSAPSTVAAGAGLDVVATVTDNVGIASVAFYVDGVLAQSVAGAPYRLTWPVPATAAAGAVIQIEARAVDFSSLEGRGSATTTVAAPRPFGQGVVTGEAYDDTTGLPLAGVTVRLQGRDEQGTAYGQSVVTDAQGRFVLEAGQGQGTLEFVKTGFTASSRPVDIVSGAGVETFDARLTPVRHAPVPLQPVAGGQLDHDGVTLVVSPGSLAASASLQVTRVGAQGLVGLLPPGWAPVASVDVLPHGVTFVGAVPLSITNAAALPAATPVVFAAWDPVSSGWRALATFAAGGAAPLTGAIDRTGQFGWFVADVQPFAPPAAVVGELLQAALLAPVPDPVPAVVTPNPKVIFYDAGVKSDVEGRVTSPVPLSSGTPIVTRLRETYDFRNGSRLSGSPMDQDLVLFQRFGVPHELFAQYPVSPSLTFDPLALDQGTIGVEAHLEPAGARSVPIVGAAGGRVAAPTGEAVDVPARPGGAPLAVGVQPLTAADLGLSLPPLLDFAGGMLVSFPGALANPAVLSFPLPSGVTAADQILIARLQDIGGATRLVLVALGAVSSGAIVSDTSLGGVPGALDGVTEGGRYVALRLTSAAGFATGLVTDASGAAFSGALVGASTVPVVALSRAAGTYVVAALVGPATLTAEDVARADSGSGAGVVGGAGAVIQVPLTITASGPRVVSVTPADQAVNVPLGSPVVVVFTRAIDPASVTGGQAGNVLLTDGQGGFVAGVTTFSSSGTTMTFRPAAPLAPNAQYVITLGAGIADALGRSLGVPVQAAFQSLDTAPPPVPAPGSVTASIPSAASVSVVTATQGTAAPTDRVFVDNLTQGTTAVAVLDPNGGFLVQIGAAVADKLRVRIIDQHGNETVVGIDRFQQTNADGSVSAVVDQSGGLVIGPNGVIADVPEAAFSTPTVVTVQSIPVSTLPVSITGPAQARAAVYGAIGLDIGTAKAAREIGLSLPSQGEGPDARWVVAKLVPLRTGPALAVVDTARVIDGRVTTSSPPFPGVVDSGSYVVVGTSGPTGSTHGKLSSGGDGLVASLVVVNPTSIVPMPWIILGQPEPSRWGFPFLSEKVTIVNNSVRLKVGAGIAPADRELFVTNQQSGLVQSFPLNPVDYRVEVPGDPAHGFTVKAFGPGGAQQTLTSMRVSSGQPNTVRIRPNPDLITVPVETLVVTNKRTNDVHSFSFAVQTADVGVEGAQLDPREVRIKAVDGTDRIASTATYRVDPSPYGAGNLVAKAVPGTIEADRVRIEIAGGGQAFDVPLNQIVNGGFAFAFTGDANASYTMTVHFASRVPHQIAIPRFQVTVTSALTGAVVRTFSGFVPPADEPLDLGDISDDLSIPYVLSGPQRLGSFDPNGNLTFTFSEAMNATTLKTYITVLDGQGSPVAGTVHVSGGNRVATFVPAQPLRMNEAYQVRLQGRANASSTLGIKDAAGNLLADMTVKVTTFKPQVIGRYAGSIFKDVAIARQTQNNQLKTWLAVTTGHQSPNLLLFDATSPSSIMALGAHTGAVSQQRVAVVPGASITDRSGAQVQGDLAITTNFNVNSSAMEFVNIFDRTAPASLGIKVLTVNPDLVPGFDINRPTPNTVFTIGWAKGVTALPTLGGVTAYAAVELVGVMASDVGQNSPTRINHERIREPIFPGDFHDIVSSRGQLVVIGKRPEQPFVILSPNLAPVGSTGLPYTPRRLRVVDGMPVDLNGDALIGPNEVFTLAVVGADGGIAIVDIKNPAMPQVIGTIPIAGTVRDVEVDPVTRRIVAGVDLGAGGPTLMLLDLSRPAQVGLLDQNNDGADDRLLWQQTIPNGVNGLRLDADRGMLYIAHTGGLDIWSMYDTCCDLGVDLRPRPDDAADGASASLLIKERRAIQIGIAQGLDKAASTCGVDPNEFRMFESGSSACLWDPDPSKTCDGNYQPGISDHDVSMFFPQKMWEESVGGKPRAVCVITELQNVFVDKNKRPIPIKVPAENGNPAYELAFRDISFLGNRLREYAKGLYSLFRTDPSIPGDAINDIGLGRQLLLLKHVSESRWVDLGGPYPGVGTPTYPAAHVAYDLSQPDQHFPNPSEPAPHPDDVNLGFEATMTKLRERTGVPYLEGYEWAHLMEVNLLKSMGFVRIKGAIDEAHSLHPFYLEQLHTVGKAGIRSALARLVADPIANRRTLDVTRGGDPLVVGMDPNRQADGRRGRLVLEGNACLFVDENIPAEKWATKPCNSLEEYMASAAAWTLRPYANEGPLTLFSFQDVIDIYRFFQVKSDRFTPSTEAEADALVQKSALFIERVKNETRAIYNQTKNLQCPPNTLMVACDPWWNVFSPVAGDGGALMRDSNLTKQAVVVADKKKAHFHVIPRFYNRSYRDAADVRIQMVHTRAGGGSIVREARLTLDGGDNQFPEWELDQNGQPVLTPKNSNVPLFEPDVDQYAAKGLYGSVIFSIDLPDRSVKEADRTNNWNGFTYFVLDPTADAAAQAAAVPSLTAPFTQAVLDPDLECVAEPALVVSQQARLDGRLLDGTVQVPLNHPVTLVISVLNPTANAIDNATVCSTLSNQCYQLGTVQAGATVTREIVFTSAAPVVADAVPTVYSDNTSVETTAPLRLVVGCEEYAVVPLAPDPNPRGGRFPVMRGGSAVRYFKVVKTKDGQPLAGATVKATIAGGGHTQTLQFTTNAEGVTQTGTVVGMNLPVPATAPTGTVFTITVDEVNGQPPVCQPLQAAEATVTDLTYSKGISFGASLGVNASVGLQLGKLKVFQFGVNGAIGGAGDMTSHLTVDAGQATATDDTVFSANFFREVGVSASVGPKIKFDTAVLGQKIKMEGSPINLSGSLKFRTTEFFDFKFPVAQFTNATGCALTNITLPLLLGDTPRTSNIQDAAAAVTERRLDGAMMALRRLSDLRERDSQLGHCPTDATFFASTKTEHARTGDASFDFLKFEAKLDDKTTDAQGNPVPSTRTHNLQLKFGASALAQAAVIDSVETGQSLVAGSFALSRINHSYTLKGQANYQAGLDIALKQVPPSPPAEPKKQDEVKRKMNANFKGLGLALKHDILQNQPITDDPNLHIDLASAGYNESYKVDFHWDLTQGVAPWGADAASQRPTSLSITYRGKKTGGWIPKGGTVEARSAIAPTGSRRYTFTTQADIDKAVQKLAAIDQIRSSWILAQTVTQPFLPTMLDDEFAKFVELLLETSPTIEDVNEDQDAVVFNIGGSISVGLFDAGGTFQIRADSKVGFVGGRGEVVAGEAFLLERYPRSLFPSAQINPAQDLFQAINAGWNAAYSAHQTAFPRQQATPTTGQSTSVTTGAATVALGADALAPGTPMSAVAFDYDAVAGPVAAEAMGPLSTSGPAGVARYGIGGFHNLMPVDAVLATPSSLTVTYTDQEIAGLSESTLLVFVYDPASADWQPLASQVDASNNRVTATITRLGFYTVGVPMPAGGITLASTDQGLVGAGATTARRFLITSGVLRLNTGGPVADGTTYTVQLGAEGSDVTGIGIVLGADADPVADGHQVTAQGGILQFVVEFPAPGGFAIPGSVLVFATPGTAVGILSTPGGQP